MDLTDKFRPYLESSRLQETLDSVLNLAPVCLRLLDVEGRNLMHGTSSQLSCPFDPGNVSMPPPCTKPGAVADCLLRLHVITMPVVFQDHELGRIAICGSGTAEQVVFLGTNILNILLDTVNYEYDLDNLSSEILEKYEELNVLYDIGERLSITMDREEICRVALEKVQQVVGAEKVCIALVEPGGSDLEIIVNQGFAAEQPAAGRIIAPEGIACTVARTGKPVVVDRVEELPEAQQSSVGASADDPAPSGPFLSAPIKKSVQVLGVINAAGKGTGDIFKANDLKLVMALGSQAGSAIRNIQMVEELKRTEALQREMEIARTIQMKLLPTEPLRFNGVRVAGRCTTAAKVGGDYFDHVRAGDGCGESDLIHLLIADVSGHDVSAALMMFVARKVFHAEIEGTDSPRQVMRNINRLMYDDLSQSELFITMFYAQYFPKSRLLRFSNGGHNPPFLVRERGTEVESLDTDGLIIGVLEDVEYEEGELTLDPGNYLVFYTDGVVESENPAGEQYGLERFHRLMTGQNQLGPGRMLDRIYRDVATFSRGKAQYDDITVMILKTDP